MTEREAEDLRRFSTPRLLLMCAAAYAFLGALLFGIAGRLDLPWVWASLAVLAVSHLGMILAVFRTRPELARERLLAGPGIPEWDRRLMALGTVLTLLNLAVSLADAGRWQFSDSIPTALRIAGLVAIPVGMGLLSWAMAVNPFFSRMVRIQEERNHRTITEGPYHWIRHPGYLGWILVWAGLVLTWGSWLGLCCSLLADAFLVARARREDLFLHENLEGYAAYADEVSWRLLPGIW